MIYIIISNAYYYPSEGAADWRCVTPDFEVAKRAYADAEGDSVYLIGINANGVHTVLEARQRG